MKKLIFSLCLLLLTSCGDGNIVNNSPLSYVESNKIKDYIDSCTKQKQTVDIKSKFGNDVILILGNWSMNKKGIKKISSIYYKKTDLSMKIQFILMNLLM
jgi:hypothetical protein